MTHHRSTSAMHRDVTALNRQCKRHWIEMHEIAAFETKDCLAGLIASRRTSSQGRRARRYWLNLGFLVVS
jgi:hypothetical protein